MLPRSARFAEDLSPPEFRRAHGLPLGEYASRAIPPTTVSCASVHPPCEQGFPERCLRSGFAPMPVRSKSSTPPAGDCRRGGLETSGAVAESLGRRDNESALSRVDKAL